MSIQPSKPSYQQDFGGTKVDYAPIFDPSTDRKASEINSVFATTAGLVQTTPIAKYKLDFDPITNLFTITKNLSFIGNGFETCTYVSTGTYTFRMYTAVFDFLNNPQTIIPNAIIVNQNSMVLSTNLPRVLSAQAAYGSDSNGAYIELSIICKDMDNNSSNPQSFVILIY